SAAADGGDSRSDASAGDRGSQDRGVGADLWQTAGTAGTGGWWLVAAQCRRSRDGRDQRVRSSARLHPLAATGRTLARTRAIARVLQGPAHPSFSDSHQAPAV